MRPGAFAAAVAGRHGAATGRFNRLSLVLRGARRPALRHGIAGARHVHHHRPVRVALNFRHLELGRERSTVVHTTVRAAPLPARIVTRTVHRTIATTRVEHRVPVPGRAAPLVASTLPLVVRRQAPAEQATNTPAPRPDPRPTRERFTQPPPAPAALPPLELERVTDHVLKSLDRRMTSWRERRGKS